MITKVFFDFFTVQFLINWDRNVHLQQIIVKKTLS